VSTIAGGVRQLHRQRAEKAWSNVFKGERPFQGSEMSMAPITSHPAHGCREVVKTSSRDARLRPAGRRRRARWLCGGERPERIKGPGWGCRRLMAGTLPRGGSSRQAGRLTPTPCRETGMQIETVERFGLVDRASRPLAASTRRARRQAGPFALAAMLKIRVRTPGVGRENR